MVSGTCATANKRLDLAYTFDENGNVAHINDGVNGRQTRGMAYDGLDRLTQVTSNMFGTASYGYDVLDNLAHVQLSGGQARDQYYCYDSSWRLTNVKTSSCTGTTVVGLGYDVQGNLANKNGQAYVFDYGNRLRSATGKAWYGYDGQGRRVLNCNTSPSACDYQQYAFDGKLYFHRDNRAAKYFYNVYLGNSLVAIRELPTATGATETVLYQHTDALGTPIAVTDANKALAQTSEYEPYGQLLNRALTDGVGFTGHVQDAATGLTYMQQRYYDPAIGAMLSVDPVTAYSNPVGMFNRYRYANGNPYTFKDPDGRCANRYSDGTCQVTVEASTGAAGIAAGKQLEATLNKFDKPINSLANGAKFDIKDRSGSIIGSMTGKEIKKVWNGTSFNITSRSFNNGGAGGGTSGKWTVFGKFNGSSDLSAKAVGDYMSAAITRNQSADVGVSTLVFHELGHVTKFGMALVDQYPVTPVVSWPRELATSSAAEAMSGAVGAPFDCSIPQGCK